LDLPPMTTVGLPECVLPVHMVVLIGVQQVPDVHWPKLAAESALPATSSRAESRIIRMFVNLQRSAASVFSART
jgi:hypothetical protein